MRARAAPLKLPVQALRPSEAAGLTGVSRPLNQAAGCMSLESVWAYPPGIPFLVPGEIIDDGIIGQIGDMIRAGHGC